MTDDTKLIENVAERIRFFFSDANIRSDKFMRRELEKKENDGFVPIETLLKFNSIKRHTKDTKVVAQAAKHDSLSGRVKLNDSETAIGRKVPFDKSKMSDNVKLSLRVENLPTTEPEEGKEEKKYAVTIDEVRKLFSDYGVVALVKLQFHRSDWKKKGEDGDLKKYGRQYPVPIGAAFVEFETEEELQKAAVELCADGEEKPTKTLELGGNELRIQTMKKWVEEKEANKGDKGGGKSPKKRSRDENSDNAMELEDDKDKTEGKVKYEEFKLDWKKGHVISIKGLSDDCDREAIRGAVSKFLDVPSDDKALGVYADFSRGQTEGAIRFHNDEVAGIDTDKIPEKVSEIAAKLNDGSITIAGSKVESAAVLEGEEEETYYKNFIEFKNKQIKQKAENRARKKPRRGGR